MRKGRVAYGRTTWTVVGGRRRSRVGGGGARGRELLRPGAARRFPRATSPGLPHHLLPAAPVRPARRRPGGAPGRVPAAGAKGSLPPRVLPLTGTPARDTGRPPASAQREDGRPLHGQPHRCASRPLWQGFLHMSRPGRRSFRIVSRASTLRGAGVAVVRAYRARGNPNRPSDSREHQRPW